MTIPHGLSRAGFVVTTAVVVSSAGISGFALGGAFANETGPQTTNARGQSFGTMDNRGPEEFPDLVKVVATNGEVGYVDSDLLNEMTGGNVSSPEEAVQWQRTLEAAAWATKEIPVYEQDGITEIGHFEISRSQSDHSATEESK